MENAHRNGTLKSIPQAPENVWHYPRPPRLELVPWCVMVEFGGAVIAEGDEAYRVLETSHPPVYYIAPRFVDRELLRPSAEPATQCEWKGQAEYHDIVVDGVVANAACWSYPNPVPAFEQLTGAFAFYPSRVDACSVDGELVRAQAGDFYGGWITSGIDGGERGFKGGPGTWGW